MTSQDLADVMNQRKEVTQSSTWFSGIWKEWMTELKSFLWQTQISPATQQLSKQVNSDGNDLTATIWISTRSRTIPSNQVDMYLVRREEKVKAQREHKAAQ